MAPLIGLALAILAHTLNNSLALVITILLRRAGEEMPEPGPPPQVPFLEAWIQTSIQNLVVFLPFLIVMLVALRRSGKWERRHPARQDLPHAPCRAGRPPALSGAGERSA